MRKISGTYNILILDPSDNIIDYRVVLESDIAFLDKGHGKLVVLKDRTGEFSRNQKRK